MRLLRAATGSIGPSEVGEAPSGLARIRMARRATQPGNMSENGSSEAIGRVEKMVKEEMGSGEGVRFLPAVCLTSCK